MDVVVQKMSCIMISINNDIYSYDPNLVWIRAMRTRIRNERLHHITQWSPSVYQVRGSSAMKMGIDGEEIMRREPALLRRAYNSLWMWWKCYRNKFSCGAHKDICIIIGFILRNDYFYKVSTPILDQKFVHMPEAKQMPTCGGHPFVHWTAFALAGAQVILVYADSW